jgi:two-component sensor histidine kinase/HAMP domain-containing protein
MQWRFADLPVRIKFLVTLGIPVLGMVLLIGKQVDSNIKRSKVFNYIRDEFGRIGLYADVIHEIQRERAYAVGYLTGRPVSEKKLQLQYERTDTKIRALHDPDFMRTLPMEGNRSFNGLDVLRRKVLERKADVAVVMRSYLDIDNAMLDELGRVAGLAYEPSTKDRVYAHLRLLNAKEALGAVRDQLSIVFGKGEPSNEELVELSELVSRYETNMLLFERDATPEVLNVYRTVYQGPEVNFMRAIIGTVKERRQVDRELLASQRWWELALGAMDKLKLVEDRSLVYILQETMDISRYASLRLLIVLAALVGVVGAVAVMGFVIMRGVRNTVNAVTHAARALATGDVSAEVPVNSNDEVGQMARSFNGMIHNIRSLASSADAIGKGNYDTPVDVRGQQDVLGLALSRMKENLRAARLRDNEQNHALQEEKAKLEQANERIELLIKEMHHRVKNNLQVVASLLRLQSGTIGDERIKQAFEQSQSRVTAMALIHEKLYKGDELAMVDVGSYLQELFSELVRLNDVSDSVRYRTDIDDGLAFDLNTMVPLGLLLNELITNSLKHAFQGRNMGLIHLAIHNAEGNSFDLLFTDDGVGMPQEKMQDQGDTLGVSLIESLVDQLNGFMTVEATDKGTRYHIRFRMR